MSTKRIVHAIQILSIELEVEPQHILDCLIPLGFTPEEAAKLYKEILSNEQIPSLGGIDN